MSKDFSQNETPFDDSENYSSNPSENRPFKDVLNVATSRRAVLRGSLVGAATGFLAPTAMAQSDRRDARSGLVRFNDVTIEQASVDQTLPTISSDYEYQVLIPWGTPIEPGATRPYNGEPDRRPTAAEASKQIGIGHDGMAYFPFNLRNRLADEPDYLTRRGGMSGANTSGVLCINHEFGRNTHVLGKTDPESLEDVRISQHVHGVSVVAIERQSTGWEVVATPMNRRVHVNTPVAFSGPAADSPLLQNEAGNPPLGTVNNCGSGSTPWGTYLTCEENFNGYFGASDGLPNPTAVQQRYGFTATGFGYSWWVYDKRFDLADPSYQNEQNRFGWIVEIDPLDPTKLPTKRTAMGRFKHEAVAIGVSANGRIAAYMGDDQRFDYCYKYVSDRPWQEVIAEGGSPLDEGTLFVARFNDDFTGDWLELSMDVPALADAFENEAELLINTRLAADIVGATPMDRPEWTTVREDGSVFWTLTNNSRRTTPDAANPEAPNNDGHIIRTLDAGDFLGDTFTWEIYILASSTRGTPGVFTDPDAAFVDPDGRLFIGTDGGQPDGLQDQLVVFDTNLPTPTPRRLLVGVIDDEVTGWAHTPDYRTAFVNLQHPGNGNPASTNFPLAFDGTTIPRDATLVLTRKDGKVVGT